MLTNIKLHLNQLSITGPMKSCSILQFPSGQHLGLSFSDTFTNIFAPQNISTIKHLFMKIAQKTKMTNSRRTSRGPVQLMPGPGTGPRAGGWETPVQNTLIHRRCLTSTRFSISPKFGLSSDTGQFRPDSSLEFRYLNAWCDSLWVRCSVYWDFTMRWLAVRYRRYGTSFRVPS